MSYFKTLYTSVLKIHAGFCGPAYGATSEQSARRADDLFRIRMMEEGYTLGKHPTLSTALTMCIWQARIPSVPEH